MLLAFFFCDSKLPCSQSPYPYCCPRTATPELALQTKRRDWAAPAAASLLFMHFFHRFLRVFQFPIFKSPSASSQFPSSVPLTSMDMMRVRIAVTISTKDIITSMRISSRLSFCLTLLLEPASTGPDFHHPIQRPLNRIQNHWIIRPLFSFIIEHFALQILDLHQEFKINE